MWIPHKSITSINLCSVLSRTFNIQIHLQSSETTVSNKKLKSRNASDYCENSVEFAMLNTSELDKVKDYLARFKIHNSKMNLSHTNVVVNTSNGTIRDLIVDDDDDDEEDDDFVVESEDPEEYYSEHDSEVGDDGKLENEYISEDSLNED
ncbi:hypothetical protein HK096_010466 [Nowakowskiella sp. JEL0078]|nr:hypothetical protein HK096_010466 [Nowakowskiella sp. JEL0078]